MIRIKPHNKFTKSIKKDCSKLIESVHPQHFSFVPYEMQLINLSIAEMTSECFFE